MTKAKMKIVKEAESELETLIKNDPDLTVAMREKLKRSAQGMEAEWLKHVSPAGKLGLPELLDARRLEYGIVDSAFDAECLFDRIYLWQIPRTGGDTYEGTSILRPQQAKQREEETCPRGIIVSAGMKALDNLRSNGVDLGHICVFIRSSPWRIPIGLINGIEIPGLMVMRDGDLIASEDLSRLRRNGKVTTQKTLKADGGIEHNIVNPDGSSVATSMPWMSDDY